MSTVNSFILSVINGGGVPQPDTLVDNLYFAIMPPGTNPPPNLGGEHSVTSITDYEFPFTWNDIPTAAHPLRHLRAPGAKLSRYSHTSGARQSPVVANFAFPSSEYGTNPSPNRALFSPPDPAYTDESSDCAPH